MLPRHATITIADSELVHRIRKGQLGLARLGVQGQAAPAVWNTRSLGLEVCTAYQRAFARDGYCTRAIMTT
jgi:hypothetical protein